MKKNYFLMVLLIALMIVPAIASAGDSCSSCPSAGVCEEAKSGASCSAAAAPQAADVKTVAGKTGAPAGTSEITIDARSLSAKSTRGAKTFVIKVKGEKAALENLAKAFGGKFGLLENKGADCELAKVASDLWIKINIGSEKEKVDYLKSLGLAIDENRK